MNMKTLMTILMVNLKMYRMKKEMCKVSKAYSIKNIHLNLRQSPSKPTNMTTKMMTKMKKKKKQKNMS